MNDATREPLPDRRGELIEKILLHQDFDSLLRLGVVLANHELDGDGCSLFLYEPDRNTIVLKESTVLTRFLGGQGALRDWSGEQAKVAKIGELLAERGKRLGDLGRTLTWEVEKDLGHEQCVHLYQFGLTRWTFWTGCPLLVDDAHADIRWSSYDEAQIGPPKEKPSLGHCELSHEEMGSILVVNIAGDGDLPRAVLRVVRKRERPPFEQADLDWLLTFADLLASNLRVAVSLSELTDLGTQLEVEDFGRTLVNLFHKVLRAEGCSIFLELDRTGDGRKFQCIATTGLVERGKRVDKEAFYDLKVGQNKTKHLTSWVLLKGQLAALTNVHNIKEEDFPDLDRPSGGGKYSEVDADGNKFEVGPLLISPLFLYQGGEVAGAIRISRRQSEVFETHEQLLFLAISKLLSRVLTTLHLRQVSEKLIKLYSDPDAMLDLIPREVCRLLGVEGASILLMKDERLTLAATAGALKGQEGKISYDFSDPHRRGWTGWVAAYRRPLLLNKPEDERLYGPDPPSHLEKKEGFPCEIREKAYRFLAVPVLYNPDDPGSQVHGVVRVPRAKKDPPFEDVHQSILTSFAARLSLALNLARRSEQLRESLVQVGTEISSERSLKEKLGVIVDAAARVTRANNVIIHEYIGPPPEADARRGRFRNSACGGRLPSVWLEIKPGRDAVPFRVVEHGEPIFAVVAKESEVIFHRKAEPNFIERENISSVAALPLRVGGETCVGCVFFNFASPQKFKEGQRQEIQMMAEYAAVAIYQARLLDETRTLAQEKSNLLRYAEHSLNHPLPGIAFFLSNLAGGVYNDELGIKRPDPEFTRRAESQHQMCKYLLYLLDLFLRIDRVESASRTPVIVDRSYDEIFSIHPSSEEDLSSLCSRAADVAEAYLEGVPKIRLTRLIQSGVRGCFDVNAVQISLLNILVNAVKHGRPDDEESEGEIRLSLNRVRDGAGDCAHILVEDTGRGIPPGERDAVFEKGYRRDRGPGGLGIGLFLTRRFVEAHGGWVKVQDSRLGSGAGVLLCLPLVPRRRPG